MEGDAKLETFLCAEEINSLSENIKNKVLERITSLEQHAEELKSENAENNAVIERQQFQFDKEISALQQQFQESAESGIKLKTQLAESEENLDKVQKQWRDLQMTHDSFMLEFQSIKRGNDLLTQEKKDLTEQLEKRRKDIEKLNGEVKLLLEQAEKANQAKYEAIADLEESKLKKSNLKHQVTRLEQEKVLLSRQIDDLNAEVSQQSYQIHTLSREKSNTILELQSQLEQNIDELHLVQKQITCLKENNESKDLKIDALAERIRELNQSRCKAEAQFNLQLGAQAKLAELYKKGSEDNQKRVTELVQAFEEAQKLLKESSCSREEMEKHCENLENECKLQLDQKSKEIAQLNEELKKLKDSTQGFNQESLEVMFPTAAATSKVMHSGMTLTDMYSELMKTQEELQRQKDENAELNQQMKQILAEIEEKTPLINQRMQEYQKSLETNACLRNQLATAYADFENTQAERNEALRINRSLERKNKSLNTLVTDLNQQVRVLLREVEEARGGFVRQSGLRYEDEEDPPNEYVTADKVISKHLITFKNIEELQLMNQRLTTIVRDLTEKQEEMEKKISEEQAEKYESEIDATKMALKSLETTRTKQNELLDTVVRQRDMYRVLLTSQGFSESFLEQPDSSLTLKSPKSAFSPNSDPRLNEIKNSMQLLQTEFDNYKKEKNDIERSLIAQTDELKSKISELRIENSKLSSQCEYSEERVNILQTNSENLKKECIFLRDKNKKHTTLITQHQQTINTLRQDILIVQEKLAKSAVSLENMKAERDLLKNVEFRLLLEKESIMKEQQQQSRVLANLQAVQNNLERMDSETKRNLQYQVEKFEKENAILKTKLENANEEYRSAVKIWEKQNKETQRKVDAEVEQSHKLHEDLVEAYSQVHALKQELSAVKSSTPERGSAPSTPSKSASTPDKKPLLAPQAAEIKLLKERLNEANIKMKALQDKLDLSQKNCEQISNMCNDLEIRLSEQDEINKHLSASMSSTLNTSDEKLLSAEKKLENMEKHNRELIEENMKISQSLSAQKQDLQSKITEVENQIESYKSQTETAVKTSEQAREDCLAQKTITQETQEKYERELMLHAEAVHSLTELKEQHQNCTNEIKQLREIAKSAQHTLEETKQSMEERERILLQQRKSLNNRLLEVEKCNSNLHDQLELMATQMAALQSKSWESVPIPSVESDLKDTHHLLQVIQFIKKEKEIVSTQYDSAKSESVRLSLKVEQLTSELKEAKAELIELQSKAEIKASSDVQHSELIRKIEMMNLLSESNNLLRMEKESLSEAKVKLENQVQELENKIQPLNENCKRLSSEMDALSAENEAIRIEVKNWQSRTNQLLEQSHRIGPQEYKNLMREIEELKSQKMRLVEELQKKQAELSQLSSNLASSNKEQERLKNELSGKLQEVAKMNDDNVEHQKTVLQIKKIGRKYKTQYDELKVSYDDLRAKFLAAENAKQEQTNQEVQTKIDEFEKNNKALLEEVEKQKEVAVQAKKEAEIVEAKANEKEERAKKLLASVRQKFSHLTNVKNSVIEEKNKLLNEVSLLRSEITYLKLTVSEKVQAKSQNENKLAHLENELRVTKELLQKQQDIHQKMVHRKQTSKPTGVGLAERSGGSGSEPLTANIKPIPAPSTSSGSPGLRHSTHPHATPTDPRTRPPPTASIRPMAIGQTTSPQARMATVPPTVTPHTEEVTPVPQATVQPTRSASPKTLAATVSPHSVVISEVLPTPISAAEQEMAPDLISTVHHAATPIVLSPPVLALVSPRIEVSDGTSETIVDSPSPTTSVIVSPTATQTQVVTPTVKRPREESPGANDGKDSLNVPKRVRMVSEGSQTNQRPVATTPPTIAVVAAARNTSVPSTSVEVIPDLAGEVTETTMTEPSDSDNVISVEETPAVSTEILEAENLDVEERDTPTIEWEGSDDKVNTEYEVMEEEVDIEGDEVGDDDQMQDTSPGDENVSDEQTDIEEMADQPTPVSEEIDIIDSGSNILMEADNSSPEEVSSDQSMAPPTVALLPEPKSVPETTPVPQTPVVFPPVTPTTVALTPVPPPAIPCSSVQPSVPLHRPIPMITRQDRLLSSGRQHLTPFTIPGQGSNFEEGDDSIVPSTPTLYVPRRADGFAEAVSSPHTPQQRFSFSSSESSPTQQGLSQLATQGALGVDDTRMDLSQFDEGGGRTVPSTPSLQISPPAEATVPEVSDAVLEQATCIDIEFSTTPIPTITVDPAEELSDSTEETLPKTEDTVTEIEDTDASKSDSKDDKAEDNLLTEATTSEVPAEKDKSAQPPDTTPAVKDPETNESQDNRDNSTAQVPAQRKPIVWKEDPSSSSSSQSLGSGDSSTITSSAPPVGLTPTPISPSRGRGRPRRMRFQAAGNRISITPYTRGGGAVRGAPGAQGPCTGTARRGRPAGRRRSMY